MATDPLPSPAERYAAARRRDAANGPELARFRDLLSFPLDDFQVESCAALERGSGVLVAAPTGAGKTVVGEFAVHLALATGRKAFYTTPIKALSNQKYADLVARYGPDRVGLLTGDTTVNGEAPVVVMTTEVLRNMLYAGSPTLGGLGFVVMDEVHYLADRFRGPVWEEVIIHLPDDVQLVSLSATVSNAEEFGDWLATVRGDTEVVVSEHRPVPLGQHVYTRGALLELYAGDVDPTDPGVDPPINPELAALLRSGDGDRRGPGGRGGTGGRGGPGGRAGRRGPGDRGYRGGGGRRGQSGGGGRHDGGGRGPGGQSSGPGSAGAGQGRDNGRPDARPGADRSVTRGLGGPVDRSTGGPVGGAGRRGVPDGPRGSRRASRFAVVEALREARMLPAIVFIFSRAGCEGAVSQCLAAGVRLTTPAEQAEIRAVVEERCASIPGEDLAVLGFWQFGEALSRGVAAHHAGMLPLFKETVEDLFSRGLVKVVFATETLALGINMPARSVVLERLVKWDGSQHVDVTPGEYTQLTGRAGRRGIDSEGHAVVVEHPGLDPVALAGLASKRLYPLRSSFRPTYNMAVNLVAQVGRDRAREVLETSFAQFQADRGVVGLARQAQSHAEALEGYAEAMTCDRGDFAEYAGLRRALGDLERDESRTRAASRRADVARSLEGLRVGDVLEVPVGRRTGFAVVIDPGGTPGFDGPRPTVLTTDREVRVLTVKDVGPGASTVGHLRVPKAFSPRAAGARRDLAAQLRDALADPETLAGSGPGGGGSRPDRADRRGSRPDRVRGGSRSARAADDDARIAELRRALRAHPCHGCPDREEHARWAERWQRLRAEHDALVRRIEGRTGSIAKVFDRTCDVLLRLGYLARDDGGATARTGGLVVTRDGGWLRRIYAENDLLLAECLRRGLWDELDVPALAAAVSTLVYSARRDEGGEPHVPGGPQGRLARALEETVRAWSELEDLESAHRLDTTAPLDLGLVGAVHRWANGRGLDAVLHGTELAAGDFVRWCKQIIDVLGQLAKAAPSPALRRTADEAIDALRRGVVAYSSL